MRSLLVRRLTSSATDARVALVSGLVAAAVVFVSGARRPLAELDLDEAQSFFGLLSVASFALLVALFGGVAGRRAEPSARE